MHKFRKFYLLLLALIFIGYGLIAAIAAYNEFWTLNPDGMAYLQIARRLAEGEWAVRPYWSPLISWMVAIPGAFGVDLMLAQRIIAWLTGHAAIAVTVLISGRIGLSDPMRLIAALGMAIFAIANAFWPITPDFLGMTVIGVYLIATSSPRVKSQPVRMGLLCGAIGAVAYFAKHYNFPFIAAHLALMAALLIWRGFGWRRAIQFTVAGWLALVVVSAPWVIAISTQTGYLTLSSSGEINRQIIGRSTADGEISPFVCNNRALCPVPENLLFDWESPNPNSLTRDVIVNPTHELTSGSVQNNLGHLQRSLERWVVVIQREHGVLPLLGLVGIALGIVLYRRNPEERFRRSWLLLSPLLYTGGYFFFFVGEYRLLFAAAPMLMLFPLRLIDDVRGLVNGRALKAIMTVTALVGMLSMLQFETVQRTLTQRRAECIAQAAPNIGAAVVPPFAMHTPLHIALAYLNNQQTFGVLTVNTAPADADAALRRNGVQSYVVDGRSELATALVNDYGWRLAAEVNFCGGSMHVLIQ